MKNIRFILPVISVSSLILANCADTSAPTLGDKISSEGNAVADIGKQWQKGEDMIKKGAKLKIKGKKEIERGDDLIKEGNQLKKNAEKSYKTKPAGKVFPTS